MNIICLIHKLIEFFFAYSCKIGDNLRTSLSFNTFIRGTIGVDVELTELKL